MKFIPAILRVSCDLVNLKKKTHTLGTANKNPAEYTQKQQSLEDGTFSSHFI